MPELLSHTSAGKSNCVILILSWRLLEISISKVQMKVHSSNYGKNTWFS